MEKGQHLLVEAISLRVLEPQEVVRFLVQCPREIGLTIISGPHVFPTDNGLAGIVLVADSHVSVHLDGLAAYIDVFSCKPFNVQIVMRLATELLLLDTKPKPKAQVLRRGWG